MWRTSLSAVHRANTLNTRLLSIFARKNFGPPSTELYRSRSVFNPHTNTTGTHIRSTAGGIRKASSFLVVRPCEYVRRTRYVLYHTMYIYICINTLYCLPISKSNPRGNPVLIPSPRRVYDSHKSSRLHFLWTFFPRAARINCRRRAIVLTHFFVRKTNNWFSYF